MLTRPSPTADRATAHASVDGDPAGGPGNETVITPERARRLDHARILIYSHDTFGLGHLRRCQAIAHALVDSFKGLSVLIISGSPIASSFEFRARVDFVKIPSVIKNYNGEYTSLDRHIDLTQTLALRRSIILHTAKSFDPDIFIVDKEPMGLRGEVEETLSFLGSRGCLKVLGLRDVMDSPRLLEREWARNDLLTKIDRHYDDIWVYGPEDFWDPFTDLPASAALWSRRLFTGFLRREVRDTAPDIAWPDNMLVVTAGGGGDGSQLMAQALAAYEHDSTLTHPLVLVLGPFMATDERKDISQKARHNPHARVIDFEAHLLSLMRAASGVVSMAGYNTFCEILSLDQRALFVPRVTPREEQLIRATRANELGLGAVLHPDAANHPGLFAAALHDLPTRPRPSEALKAVDMDGLERICDRIASYFSDRSQQTVATSRQRRDND